MSWFPIVADQNVPAGEAFVLVYDPTAYERGEDEHRQRAALK